MEARIQILEPGDRIFRPTRSFDGTFSVSALRSGLLPEGWTAYHHILARRPASRARHAECTISPTSRSLPTVFRLGVFIMGRRREWR